ncbi:hypothetical protein [Algoriphagus mannitolivorans]|uniref:hypothetical protein n=1 Tax=Algoriphagus mannitolivorans TaxID=226504 RepID=UPI0012FC5043|nr:hypothetical protein [Algoriphagus mannitolivorans]
MNKSIYKIGFFILLAINIALMVIFSMGPKRPPQRPMPNQIGIKDEIARELGFSEEQKSQFEIMAKAHRENITSLEKIERTLISNYFDQLSQENPEEKKIKLMEEIQAINREKIEVTFSHFEELKGLCAPEQLEKFEEVIAKILPAITNSGPAGPPPGNPPR